MSNAPTQKPGLILDRVKALEETVNGLAGFAQQEIQSLRSALSQLVEVVNAAILANGEGFQAKVQESLNAERKKRQEAAVEREKLILAQAVSSGMLVPADRVGDKSIVVGRELDKENNVLGVGRTQVRFDQFTEEARKQLLDQGVGFVVSGPDGQFEVLEIYNVAEQKPPVTEDAPIAPVTE